ncbi:MAG TPA: glycosyl hydrolase [Tepidisphaeraceae bacterium]|nr:glycosyl hydrolase [Tepidisphaeraceae bacterium]
MSRFKLVLVSFLFAAAWIGQPVATAQQDTDALVAGFTTPPDSAKPHAWWHWMNGNVSKAGITLDLESMKRVGIGGVHIAHAGRNIPKGPIIYATPEYQEMVEFAVKEAQRLDMDVVFFNCPGWSSSGGPWVKPEQSMKVLAYTQTQATGGQELSLTLKQPDSNLDFYRDAFVIAFPTPQTDSRVPSFNNGGTPARGGVGGGPATRPARSADANSTPIDPAKVVDLTKSIDSQGRLTWRAPAGDWTILRIGFTTNGTKNHPAPEGGSGLEIDKFSKEALDAHFEAFFGPLYEPLKPLIAKGKVGALIDSYEVGNQNWTDQFPQEFKKRRGYDMTAYMPVMAAGRVVGSVDVSQRFLWDVRKTQAELMDENYYAHFTELCRKHGMKSYFEPYHTSNFDELTAGTFADVPMGEFWQGPSIHASIKLVASATHLNGQVVTAAESFTSQTRWTESPYSLKAMGDVMWTQGLNKIVFHEYALQADPDPSAAPGMTLGPYGGHFNRNNTWWEQGKAWMQYLSRSQFLLQQGLFTGDLVYFCGENSPVVNPDPDRLDPQPPRGYAADTIDPVTLRTRVKIVDGKITFSDGLTYRLLVLPGSIPPPVAGRGPGPSAPEGLTMSVETIRNLHDLVSAGMTLVVGGPKPAKTPSLSGYPTADAEVNRLASDIWGDMNGTTVTEHALGKGHVYWGVPLASILEKLGAKPDFQMTSRSGNANINYIHRHINATPGSADADIYFVANRGQKSEDLVCTFNVIGKRPEFWDSCTGQIKSALVYDSSNSQTRVPLQLEPSGSMFVVFRSPEPANVLHMVAILKGDTVLAGTDALLDATSPTDPVQAVPEGEGGPGGRGNATPLPVPPPPPVHPIELTGAPADQLLAWEDGAYTLRTSTGQSSSISVSGLGQPREIAGPWHVAFAPNLGAPPQATFEKLISWSDHPDKGIKYFSGTATYTNQFTVSADDISGSTHLFLDLQRVQVVAQVFVNGKDLGILWKLPFRVDLTDAVHPGDNDLVVKVTNLWPNRLIGDEQLPAENEYTPSRPGAVINKMPDWYTQNLPKPPGTGRIAFAVWNHWRADEKLLESGLIGPVQLRLARRVTAGNGPSTASPRQ